MAEHFFLSVLYIAFVMKNKYDNLFVKNNERQRKMMFVCVCMWVKE